MHLPLDSLNLSKRSVVYMWVFAITELCLCFNTQEERTSLSQQSSEEHQSHNSGIPTSITEQNKMRMSEFDEHDPMNSSVSGDLKLSDLNTLYHCVWTLLDFRQMVDDVKYIFCYIFLTAIQFDCFLANFMSFASATLHCSTNDRVSHGWKCQ